MPTFALVAEGITDQIVLEHIVGALLEGGGQGEVQINYLQPLRDASDQFTSPHGGWELVLEYCRVRTLEALAVNDFLIIQIDTDKGDHPKFGLGLTKGGIDCTFDELIEQTTCIIRDCVGPEVYDEHRERIILAVSVHSIETWLLLMIFDDDSPKGSFRKLASKMKRTELGSLKKETRCYAALVKTIKKKRIRSLAKSGTSLGVFIRKLGSLRQHLLS